MNLPALRAAGTCLLTLALIGCGPAPATPPTPGASATPGASERQQPTTTPTDVAASATPVAEDIPARMRTLLGPEYNGAALVARDGVILYSEGIGMADAERGIPNEPTTRFRLGSVTKQFTAMAILLLEEDGALSIADRACDYVSDCPPGWDAITIEHLISHSSGIAEFTERPEFDPTRPATPAETIALVADVPLAFEPGRFFSYSNTGYVLLGMIIERVSGSTYEAFLDDRIFTRLGMADTGYDSGDDGVAVGYASGFEPAAFIDMSVPFAAGALYSTTLDLLRWDEALYGDELLPIAARERFFSPLRDSSDRFGMGYGFGLEVGMEGGHALVAHDGGIDGFRSYLARYPDDHTVVALLTNRDVGPDLVSLASVAAEMAREAAPVAGAEPGPRLTDAGGATVGTQRSGLEVNVPIDGGDRTVRVVYRARLALGAPICGPAIDPAAGADAASILAALQARPGWTVGAPTPVTLGAVSGWWFDLRRPDALGCPDGGINVPLFVSELDPTASGAGVHIDPSYASRLFLLDDGSGGTIAIDINAHRSFQQASLVQAAMPVILRLRFDP